MTTLLGALLFVLGMGVYHQIEKYFLLIASSSIASYGFYQIYQYRRGHRHTHCEHGDGEHHHLEEMQKTSKDGWAILSLLSLLTFSPCESFLPIYLTSVGYGWRGFAMLSVVLAVGTLVTMLSFAWVSSKTIEKYKLDWLEEHEKLIIGIGLIILAIVVYFLERQHSI